MNKDPHIHRDFSFKLSTNQELTVSGYAVSGVASYFRVSAFDMCLDMGYCNEAAVSENRILLSHMHIDHMGGIPLYRSVRQMRKLAEPTIYVPESGVSDLRNIIHAYHLAERSEMHKLNVIGVKHGDAFAIGKSRFVEVFSAKHRLDSVGYTVIEVKRKLKQEYAHLTATEVSVLSKKLKPEEFMNNVETRLLTYVGDSTIDTIAENPEILSAEVVLLEATHLGSDITPEKSKEYGHTHLSQIVDLYRKMPEAFSCKHIILKHFSLRYTTDIIKAEIDKIVPEELKAKIHLCI